MGRKVASFSSLLSFLCPPCPPAHRYNAGPLPQHTHTLTHTQLPALPPEEHRQGVGVYGVGFPQLFKQIPADGPETFLLDSRCSLSQLPVSFTSDLQRAKLKSRRFFPVPQTSSLSSQLPKHQTFWTQKLFVLSHPSSSVGSDIQLFHSARTVQRTMPSDFLTPFLELDEEFCKVRATNKNFNFLCDQLKFVAVMSLS